MLATALLVATLTSYTKARHVVDAALAAHGNVAIDNLVVEDTGTMYDPDTARPDTPYYVHDGRRTFIHDLAHDRYYFRIQDAFLGGYTWDQIDIADHDRGYALLDRFREKWATADRANVVKRSLPYEPWTVLAQAAANPKSLRYIGTATFAGRAQDVVAANEITLFIDAKTHLLTKTEALTEHPQSGDSVIDNQYLDYQRIGGVLYPMRRLQFIAGVPVRKLVATSVRVNVALDDALFAPPPGQEQETAGDLKPQRVAENVYWIRGGVGANTRSSLLVVLDDSVAVIEPQSIAPAVIAAAHEVAPGKPILYVVPTHFHLDHVGGTRDYWTEGATLLTTTGNGALFRTLADTHYTLTPDRFQTEHGRARIETFARKRTLGSGANHVELYDIGPNPHAEEMVVAYVPASGVLFTGDLVRLNVPAEPFTRSLADAIQNLHLDVKLIVECHAERVATWADFQQELALATKSAPAP